MVVQKVEPTLRSQFHFLAAASRLVAYQLVLWVLSIAVACAGAYAFFLLVERRFLNRA